MTGNWRAITLIALIVAALGAVWITRSNFTGRGRSAPRLSTAASEPESDGVVRLFLEPADVAPFSVTTLDGRVISSADLKGKVVFVNFWATWCNPCRVEIPDLIALQQKYAKEVVVIGISEDEIPVEQVKQFVDEHKMNYPVAMTSPALRKIFRGVAALPTTFVLDREGRLVQRHVGMLQKAKTEAETRVLAGLDTTTKIERFDPNESERTRLADAAEAKNIPGVDLSHLNDTQRKAVVQALIAEDCTCGCGLTVAVCRLDDPTCPVSLPLAQAIVKQYLSEPVTLVE